MPGSFSVYEGDALQGYKQCDMYILSSYVDLHLGM